mmetsp:Transcript_8226/g.12610  ORF Transcript_8226/g.12610 Transcript_8226/m.12610 type:complete len:563 (+) Transcript_8226:196-1884(+)
MSFSSPEEEECSEIFVGGGWAGVYSMYRRITGMDDDPSPRGRKVCLFEQSWRIGGRTYSIHVNHTTTPNLMVDVGAYRFSPDMHLPGDLIMKDLQIPTECYESTCPSAQNSWPHPFLFNYSAPLRRIVDPTTGLPGGYVTAIHKMVEISKQHGARVYTQTSLSKLSIDNHNDNAVSLQFYDSANNQTFTIKSPDLVVLNLPRNKLFDVQGMEDSFKDDPTVLDTLKCISFDQPTDMFPRPMYTKSNTSYALSKAYLYYEDAWWHTILNITEGSYPPAGWGSKLTTEGVRFNIRWHDGPVYCSSSFSKKCQGLLESYYSLSDETFYSSLSPNADEPLGSVWNTDGPHAIQILAQAHAGMMDLLSPLLEKKGIDPNTLHPPSGLLVGVWRFPTTDKPLGQGSYTCPTKVYYSPTISGSPANACGVPGLTEESYRDTVLQPFKNQNLSTNLFLVNNDFVCLNARYFYGDWAEESLLQAERAMYLLGMAKPPWLNSSYYQEKIVSQVAWDASNSITTTPGTTKDDSRSDVSVGLELFLLCFGLLCLYFCSKAIQRARWKKEYTALP